MSIDPTNNDDIPQLEATVEQSAPNVSEASSAAALTGESVHAHVRYITESRAHIDKLVGGIVLRVFPEEKRCWVGCTDLIHDGPLKNVRYGRYEPAVDDIVTVRIPSGEHEPWIHVPPPEDDSAADWWYWYDRNTGLLNRVDFPPTLTLEDDPEHANYPRTSLDDNIVFRDLGLNVEFKNWIVGATQFAVQGDVESSPYQAANLEGPVIGALQSNTPELDLNNPVHPEYARDGNGRIVVGNYTIATRSPDGSGYTNYIVIRDGYGFGDFVEVVELTDPTSDRFYVHDNSMTVYHSDYKGQSVYATHQPDIDETFQIYGCHYAFDFYYASWCIDRTSPVLYVAGILAEMPYGHYMDDNDIPSEFMFNTEHPERGTFGQWWYDEPPEVGVGRRMVPRVQLAQRDGIDWHMFPYAYPTYRDMFLSRDNGEQFERVHHILVTDSVMEHRPFDMLDLSYPSVVGQFLGAPSPHARNGWPAIQSDLYYVPDWYQRVGWWERGIGYTDVGECQEFGVFYIATQVYPCLPDSVIATAFPGFGCFIASPLGCCSDYNENPGFGPPIQIPTDECAGFFGDGVMHDTRWFWDGAWMIRYAGGVWTRGNNSQTWPPNPNSDVVTLQLYFENGVHPTDPPGVVVDNRYCGSPALPRTQENCYPNGDINFPDCDYYQDTAWFESWQGDSPGIYKIYVTANGQEGPVCEIERTVPGWWGVRVEDVDLGAIGQIDDDTYIVWAAFDAVWRNIFTGPPNAARFYHARFTLGGNSLSQSTDWEPSPCQTIIARSPNGKYLIGRGMVGTETHEDQLLYWTDDYGETWNRMEYGAAPGSSGFYQGVILPRNYAAPSTEEA